MFPLGSVLLPGSAIPLHVFEPRYRQMVYDVLAADGPPQFGQVLITHGPETGGADQRADVGVLAEMTSIEALEGGRYAFLAAGLARIRVRRWLEDDPYPRAEIEVWNDPAVVSDEEFAANAGRVHDRLHEVLELARQVAPEVRVPERLDLPDDPSAASFVLTALAPIGQSDRLALLSAEGPDERLDRLAGALEDVEAMLRFRLS
jgi:Lon protease-like protein